MKPATMTFLSSLVLAALSAGLAIQTAMTFVHGGGNLPNAIGFVVSVAIFTWTMIALARTLSLSAPARHLADREIRRMTLPI